MSYTADKFKPLRPQIECQDGFTMSVQASGFHYCTPRVHDAERYTEVEVGYPNRAEPDLLPYAEDAGQPTDTVYAYVPVEVVVAVIAKHGGLKAQEQIK